MSAPKFSILTQKELTIDLSRPAMQHLIDVLNSTADWTVRMDVRCEVDNFCNMLQNLLERSEPKPENFDLIGE